MDMDTNGNKNSQSDQQYNSNNYMTDSQSIYSQNPTNPIANIIDIKMFPFSMSGQVHKTIENNLERKCVPITDITIQNSYLKLENIKLLNAYDFLFQENVKLKLNRNKIQSQQLPSIKEKNNSIKVIENMKKHEVILNKRLKALEVHYDKILKAYTELHTELINTESKLIKIETQNKVLTDDLKTGSELHEQVVVQNKALIADIQILKENIEEMDVENVIEDELMYDLKLKSQELENAKLELRACETKYNDIKHKLDYIINERDDLMKNAMNIETLNDVNKAMDNELLELREKNELLLSKNLEILKEKQEMKMNLDKTTENVSKQRNRIESLQNIIDQKNAYIDDFNVISNNINSSEMKKGMVPLHEFEKLSEQLKDSEIKLSIKDKEISLLKKCKRHLSDSGSVDRSSGSRYYAKSQTNDVMSSPNASDTFAFELNEV